MPELPEVETIVSDLCKKVVGREIIGFWSQTPRIFPKKQNSKLKSQIKGYQIAKI